MKLNYKISGEGSPLIILHGLFGTLENWGSQITSLSTQYKVISVDIRNHGRSPHSDDMSYPLMAQDITHLMNDLEIPSAHIIGHSMGGKVAMQIALNHPDRVQKLIIVDISPVMYPVHHKDIFSGLNSINLTDLKSRTDADNQLQPYIKDLGIRSFLLKNLYRDQNKNFAWRPNLNILQQKYNEIRLPPENPNGSVFDGSTLFIKGNNSDYIQKEHKPAIDAIFSNVKFKIIEGAGHWPHAEKAKIFSTITLKFLAT